MNPWQCEWPAPAKLNLFLHVVGRRADGYHLLQTVFRFLDFGDSLSFAPRNDDRILLATPLFDDVTIYYTGDATVFIEYHAIMSR